MAQITSIAAHNFNPRSREGSDGSLILSTDKIIYFNPRSREGSDGMVCLHLAVLCHFNPRSREGSDLWDI